MEQQSITLTRNEAKIIRDALVILEKKLQCGSEEIRGGVSTSPARKGKGYNPKKPQPQEVIDKKLAARQRYYDRQIKKG